MMEKREKIRDTLTACAEWIFGIAFLMILFLVLFAASRLSYGYKGEFQYPNLVYLLLGVFLWLTARWAERLCPRKVKEILFQYTGKLLFWATLLLACFLVYLVYNYYFLTGWDSFTLLETSRGLAGGRVYGPEDYESYYFSTYPNNFFMLAVCSVIIKLESWFGILDVGKGVMGVLTVQCVLSALSAYLVFKIAYSYKKSLKTAWEAWFMYVLIVGVSPWISIPYSDGMGLIFPVLVLYLYTSLENGKYVKTKLFFMAAAGIVGYKIKPQLIIILLALFIVAVLRWITVHKDYFVRQRKNFAAFLAGMLFSFFAIQVVTGLVPIAVNDKETFGPAHYIMMGLNKGTNGGYWEEDVQFTHNQKKEGRTKANLEVISQRMKEYGPGGLMEHLVKKTLNNYGDGTWAWGAEGGFYEELYEDKNNGVSPVIKSIYYHGGNHFYFFTGYSQAMWLMLLTGCFLAFVFRKKIKEKDICLILMLSILGLTIFELIFESRARYLFCYVPIYILLAQMGMEQFFRVLGKGIKGLRGTGR